jgi:hypothetical protein
MGNFKIEQQAQAEPVYCDYIQEKIDIARENGAVYELADEDYRIQALYDVKPELQTKDVIKVINRVRSNDDGKEYIVVNKNVDFLTQDGVFKDRYSTREGIVELPLKTTNPDTGAAETKQNRLVYTIPFSASKVDEYLEKAEGQGSIPQMTFYEGATTSNRLPSNIPAVSNPEFFKEASWTELLVGREKKLLNSLINRLPDVRKELNQNNSSTTSKRTAASDDPQPTEIIERQEISPSDPRNQPQQPSPKEEVNKLEKDNENSSVSKAKTAGEGESGSTSGGDNNNTPSRSSPFSRGSNKKS